MKKIAYLTMADMGDFVTDFHLSIGFFLRNVLHDRVEGRPDLLG